MKKEKCVALIVIILALIMLIPSIANATEEVKVTRNVYSNNGSMKFSFSGLNLDTTHEYEYGLTKTAATAVETWFSILEYTNTTAVIDIATTTDRLREVINAVDTGYITIKDKTTDTVVLQPYSVDLKIPYLQVTNYQVIPNGKDISTSKTIEVALRNSRVSTAYYQYEKITDTAIINKYKEIKAQNGNYLDLQSILKTTVPTGNWKTWGYWNGYESTGMDGFGYTESTISVPDSGLYYMWVYFSGNNLKNIYGCILVDNLEPDIALEGISLPKTKEIELGKTESLSLSFNPSNATNKIVTWSSSNESVATVDNAGKVTAKKVGSTIITVVSEDGNKKATCTVTVTEKKDNNSSTDNTNKDNTNNNINNGSTNNVNTNNGSNNKINDNTTATGKLPQTGVSIGLTLAIVIIAIGGVCIYFKYNNLKDI